MTTFSQMVDLLAKEIVRPDMVTMLPDYLNQTIRELHTNAQTSLPVLYNDNRMEGEIVLDSTVNDNDNYVWPLPNINRLQVVEAVYFHYCRRYAQLKSPGVARVPNIHDPLRELYYYRIANSVVFSRPGGEGDKVDISYFLYPKRLVYYPSASRKVTYDQESELFTYSNGGTVADLPNYTNWLLSRHPDCLMEGVRAKAYKRMDDQNRARLAYSQFESARAGLIATEEYSPDAIYTR